MEKDGSFWHKLEEQQSIGTVGLGFVTTDPSDPSTSYWPGPGLAPPFKVRREWITHHTSLSFSSNTIDSGTSHTDLDLPSIGPGIGQHHSHRDGTEDSFRSDILITYKLKNPAQFLRDVFDISYMEEFDSQFAGLTKYYLMTGYKVSRDVQSAIDHDKFNSNDMHFELSARLTIPKIATNQKATLGAGNGHFYLSSIQFQSPGDSIFYVRYLPVEIQYSSFLQTRVMVVPTRPQSWQSWLLGGFAKAAPRTIIVPRDTAISWSVDGGNCLRMLHTAEPLNAAIRRMKDTPRIATSGRQTTMHSIDDDAVLGVNENTPLIVHCSPVSETKSTR